MRDNGKNQFSASIKNLRGLFWLRNMVILLSSTVLVLLTLDVPLRTLPIVIPIGSMLFLNGLTWRRVKSVANVSEAELFVLLLGDIATLTGLFYFTGGYTNPLIWMYLLPLAVAAVALRTNYVWSITTIAVACYSALVFFQSAAGAYALALPCGRGVRCPHTGYVAGLCRQRRLDRPLRCAHWPEYPGLRSSGRAEA